MKNKMPIVATMLSGNSEPLVADAVRSVIEWVDMFLLIDTGITDHTAVSPSNWPAPSSVGSSSPGATTLPVLETLHWSAPPLTEDTGL